MRETELLKKPIFWLVLALILIWTAVFSLPDKRLHLVFCDVGQGDAILVSYRTTQILIDGGPDNRVLNCLSGNMPFWDRTIEMVILTHPEKDHLTGLIDVFKRYQIEQFVSNSVSSESLVFNKFQEAVLEERALSYAPQKGDKFLVDGVQFRVLWPEYKVTDENWQGNSLNEISIVLELSFANFDILLTGDISSKVEEQLELAEVEVLKVAHHGSKFSTSEDFLKKIKPRLAVISVGKDRFGHPTEEVIRKLRDLDIRILRTDKDGEIEIVSDGQRWYTD